MSDAFIADLHAGRFEEAFLVTAHSTRADLSRAHIRKLHKYRHDAALRALINRAYLQLTRESALEKAYRHMRLGKRESALVFFKTQLDDTHDPDLCQVIARLLGELWRNEEATVYLEQAVTLRGDAEDHLRLGKNLESLERFEDASAQYSTAVKKRGSSSDHFHLGHLLFRLAKPDTALPHLKAAAHKSRDPNHTLILKKCKIKLRWQRLARLIAKLFLRPTAMDNNSIRQNGHLDNSRDSG